MPRKSLKELQEALRQAEAEFAEAIKPSEVGAAAKKVMWAKKALKAAEEEAEREDIAEGFD
jgi:Sec-independent protein translocase protein TatA